MVIVLLTRFAIRLMQATLDGVAEGRLHLPGIHPETAAPSKRLIAALLWLFAIVVSYPYLPGSHTDAFKGVSVFLGLVLSIGSSGLVTHMMSGFLLTFTRAIKPGDYIKAGDTEGMVTNVGLLSTKLRTHKGEEVILPNAVAIGGTIVNYSRYASAGELLLYTSVTIGYDTPWRQVEALLKAAAARTPGLSSSREPFVLQRELADFYVDYQLNAVLERPGGENRRALGAARRTSRTRSTRPASRSCRRTTRPTLRRRSSCALRTPVSAGALRCARNAVPCDGRRGRSRYRAPAAGSPRRDGARRPAQ